MEAMKLSDEELARFRNNDVTTKAVVQLLDHISTITAELSQAQAELAAMPVVPLGKKLVDENAVIICDEGLPDAMKFLAYAKENGLHRTHGSSTLYRWALDRLKAASAAQPPTPEPRGATRILPQAEIDDLLGAEDAGEPPAQPVAVEVRPLAWEHQAGGGWIADNGELGFMRVAASGLRWQLRVGNISSFHATEKEAMQAGQEMFNTAILSAINARPVDAVKAEALREVAGEIEEAISELMADRDRYDEGLLHAALIVRNEADRLDPKGGA